MSKPDPPIQVPDDQNRGGGHRHLAMIACCIPMLLLAIALVAAGVVSAGFIVGAVLCVAMMAMMMFAMSRSG